MEPIVAQCIVKRYASSTTFLHWDCERREGSGTVLCNSKRIDDFSCGFGEILNVTGFCDCDSPVIISEATVFAPPAGGNETLLCSNGIESKAISITTPGLPIPICLNVLCQ